MKGITCHGKKSELNSINYREAKKFFKHGMIRFIFREIIGGSKEAVFFT